MPYGFHVESVSIRKAEIEGATRLAAAVGELLRPSREEGHLGSGREVDEVVDAQR